jgi:PAS domain S-box-containing protein
MALTDRLQKPSQDTAPALFRLLADSALSRAALSACGFPVALADATLKGRPITYSNQAFEDFFGFRKDEALGRPAITLLFPEDEASSTMFEQAPARLLMRARRKDRSVAQVEVTIGMVNGADGRLTHWVLSFADRSEMERLREELRVLKAIAASP